MGYWDQYGDADDGSVEFVTFKQIGDQVHGTIVELREGEDFNNNPCPEVVLQTASGRKIWTVGQTVAKRRMIELRPEVGWEIRAEYTDNSEGKPGRAPAKLIDIEVVSRDDPPQPSVASAADL